MDYIFKNDFLDIGSKNKNTNFQYYQWAQKKRVQKEKAQYQQFKKLWFDANEQDQQKEEIQLKKAKSIDKKLTVMKPEQLYRKNMEWKQGIDEKLSKIREEKKEKQDKQLETLFLSRQKEPKILRDSQHKGPIKAWKERFDGYLKSKCGEELKYQEQYDFRPTIDRNSRRIMKQSSGNVQDRLIEYGERLKVKKAQMETIFQQQLHAQRNSNHQQSAVSDSSDVYWRLYKDGQRLNKKRNEQKSQFSFTPSINSNSATIASKIQEKRIPLYHSKVLNSKAEQTNRQQQTNKRGTEKSFNDFLRRNEALLLKIQKNKLKKMDFVKEKQNNQIRQCTFTPVLNPKSLRMFSDVYSRRNINQTEYKIENLSQIEAMTPLQEQSLEKRVIGVKSDVNNDVNNSDKLAKSTQRIQRLHSDGNLNKQSNPSQLYIQQEDSISNINKTQQSIQINQSSQFFMRRETQKLQSNDSDFFTVSKKYEKEHFQHIYEEPQEDSIERQKQNQWLKQLNMMEKQIQSMMQRATL